jgi:cell volume regulation protein A
MMTTNSFGAFTLNRARSGEELDAADGPGLLPETERQLSIIELIEKRFGGKPDHADKVKVGRIVLILRDTDENVIETVGIFWLEPVTSATRLPLFLNLRELIRIYRDFIHMRRH